MSNIHTKQKLEKLMWEDVGGPLSILCELGDIFRDMEARNEGPLKELNKYRADAIDAIISGSVPYLDRVRDHYS